MVMVDHYYQRRRGPSCSRGCIVFALAAVAHLSFLSAYMGASLLMGSAATGSPTIWSRTLGYFGLASTGSIPNDDGFSSAPSPVKNVDGKLYLGPRVSVGSSTFDGSASASAHSAAPSCTTPTRLFIAIESAPDDRAGRDAARAT